MLPYLGAELAVLIFQTPELLVQEVIVDEAAEGSGRLVPFHSVAMETQKKRSGSKFLIEKIRIENRDIFLNYYDYCLQC